MTQSFRKIYLSLYLKGLCVRGSWRLNRTTTYWTPHSIHHNRVSFPFSWVAQPDARGPSFLLDAGFLYHIFSPTSLVSKLTDFLSTPSYIIVRSPTQSLEWHFLSSSSGNNCHAVHRSLSSSASVYDCTAGFYLVPYCQPSSPPPMEYALPPSLKWHVWPGRRSIYNISSLSLRGDHFKYWRYFYRTIYNNISMWNN